ncbi:MAG: acyl carrier protein [Ilumatobacteraceae bacterium]
MKKTKENIMSQEHFERFVNVATSTLSVAADKVIKEARFKEDLECDSLDLVTFVMDLEEEFGLSEIPSEEYEKMSTVGEAFDLIMSKLS